MIAFQCYCYLTSVLLMLIWHPSSMETCTPEENNELLQLEHPTAECTLSESGARLECVRGIRNEFEAYSCSIRSLILVEWPDDTFPAARVLRRFPMVENLTVVNSSMASFSEDFPSSADRLKTISLNGLKSVRLTPSLVSRLPSLETLDLRDNAFESVHPDLIGLPPNLKKVHVLGNKWNCSSPELRWLAYLDHPSHRLARSRIVDYFNLTCQGIKYPGKPFHVVMNLLKVLRDECPKNCSCDLANLVRDPTVELKLVPVTTVDCRYRGLTSLPDKLPRATTMLMLQGNNISDLRPLAQNGAYKRVSDIYLDDNNLTNVNTLEGADWLQAFRLLSLRGNNISQIPTYAFEYAFEYNLNIAKLYLGNNPWQCNCQFTPGFQELLFRYKGVIADIADVRCAWSEQLEISHVQINTLSRSVICKKSNETLHVIDIINIILASLICLVMSKFGYDYYQFKKTGRLPWISSKIP